MKSFNVIDKLVSIMPCNFTIGSKVNVNDISVGLVVVILSKVSKPTFVRFDSVCDNLFIAIQDSSNNIYNYSLSN